MPDNTTVSAGAMPSRQGQLALVRGAGLRALAAGGGDIAFGVGFVVGLVGYAGIRWLETGTLRDAALSEPVHAAA